jgi:hypothetical protein
MASVARSRAPFFAVAVALLVVSPSGAAERNAEPTFKIQCRKANDSVTVAPEKKRTLVVVTSEAGFGGATIDLKSGEWPANVTFQFRYPALGRSGGFQPPWTIECGRNGGWKPQLRSAR